MGTKPMLFNIDMVRAILAGKKTVTRRVVKPQPAGDGSAPIELITRPGFWNSFGDDFVYRQPYEPGDILYVREAWSITDNLWNGMDMILYGADYNGNQYSNIRWRPSIHMPKEAARIFLRVKDVRVERLQNISLQDCMKEGISKERIEERDAIRLKAAAKSIYEKIWNSTIKPADRAVYGWDANPWVWVIEFERCEKPEGWPGRMNT